MKLLRIFVLVLLATLLPLRGVSAAALPCEQQPASHTELVASEHAHDMADTAGDEHSRQHDHDHIGADKGRHCLSACSVTPLISALPTIASPPAAGTIDFPHVAAPAPTFQSEGQERPPRST